MNIAIHFNLRSSCIKLWFYRKKKINYTKLSENYIKKSFIKTSTIFKG